jgi:hypothetical protein
MLALQMRLLILLNRDERRSECAVDTVTVAPLETPIRQRRQEL